MKKTASPISLPLLGRREKEKGRKMSKLDWVVLLVLVVVYSAFTFLNLGTTNFPTTVYSSEETSSATVDFGREVYIQKAWVNPNIGEGTVVFTADDGGSTGYEIIFDYMFRWAQTDINLETKTLKITTSNDKVRINEIAFFDENGELVPVTEVGGQSCIVDEQGTVPEAPSYFNGMYFDELYHARTAYENVNNMSIYEWTHPPLGKLIISVGIQIFGMTPFGWRFMGALFGVLMLPVLYVFAKRIFKRTDFSLVVTGLFAFDCMHFAQTRISTIDTYGVFFILLMYLFMYEYITMEHDKEPFWKSLLPLGLCGLSFALGISSKWIGFYAAAGLAVLLFSSWGWRLYDLIKNKKKDETINPSRINWFAFVPIVVGAVLLLRSMADDNYDLWYEGLLNLGTLIVFVLSLLIAAGGAVFYHLWNRSANTATRKMNQHIMVIPWCCLFFVLIPAVIYFVSFFPYYRYAASISTTPYGFKDAFELMWQKQMDMYRYHSTLIATHSSSSMWYQWPLMSKSTWFYFASGNGLISNISSTGNAFVWWVGFIGFFGLMIECVISDIKNSNVFLKVGCGAVFATYVVFLIAYTRGTSGVVPTALFIVMMVLTVGALVMTRQATVKTLTIAFLANYLPWALVSRCVFIYHFFATVPFILLAAAYWLFLLEEKNPKLKWVKWAWLGLGILYFLLILPAISGIPVTKEYATFIENFLPGGQVYHAGV